MGREHPIELPKIVATFTIELHEDGNMSLAFSGPLASAPVAEHMLKKAMQGLDDERFAAFLAAQKEMGALVKAANPGVLKSLDLGRHVNNG